MRRSGFRAILVIWTADMSELYGETCVHACDTCEQHGAACVVCKTHHMRCCVSCVVHREVGSMKHKMRRCLHHGGSSEYARGDARASHAEVDV